MPETEQSKPTTTTRRLPKELVELLNMLVIASPFRSEAEATDAADLLDSLRERT